jgi:methylisocitrate lyase
MHRRRARAVSVLERAGASAVHIEDHEFGKHVTRKPRVLPLEQAAEKVAAAVAAKDSAEFMVIARTDAGGAHGSGEALRRAVAFQEAGADAVFMPGYGAGDEAPWDAARAALKIPIVDVNIPGRSAQEAGRLGTDVVLYYALGHLAALQGIRSAYAVLAAERSATTIEATLPDVGAFDLFLGIEAARETARRYRLVD